MALTNAQRDLWLSNDFHRIVLMDLGYHDGTSLNTLHFASYPYIMPQGDSWDTGAYINNTGNLLSYPDDLANSDYWLVTGELTENYTVAPDGTNTAVRLLDNLTASQSRITQWNSVTADTEERSYCVYLKNIDYPDIVEVLISYSDGLDNIDSYQESAVFVDLDTVTVDHIVGAAISYGIVDVGNGWRRVYVTGVSDGDPTFTNIGAIVRTHGGYEHTGSIAIWGPKLTLDSVENPYYIVPTNLIYDDIISSIPTIGKKIDSDSTAGTLTLLNSDGEYDYLLSDGTIVGHPIKLSIGDINWPRDNFIPILDGIVGAVSSSSQDSISITLRDRKEILNVPIQTVLYTENEYWSELMDRIEEISFGSTITRRISGSEEDGDLVTTETDYTRALAVLPDATKDTHVPICLGKCLNITPRLVDSYNHIYQVHDTGIENIEEVRSNGITLDRHGLREMVLTDVTSPGFFVGDIIYDDYSIDIKGYVTKVEGIIPNQTIQYYIHNTSGDLLNEFRDGSGEFYSNVLTEPELNPDPNILVEDNYDVTSWATGTWVWSSGKLSINMNVAGTDYVTIKKDILETVHSQYYVLTIKVENYVETGFFASLIIYPGYDGITRGIVGNGLYQFVMLCDNSGRSPEEATLFIGANGGTGTLTADITYWSIKDLNIDAAGATAVDDTFNYEQEGQYEIDTTIGLIRLLSNPNDTQITCDVIGQNTASSLRDPTAEDLVQYSTADLIEWLLLEKAGITNTEICYNTFGPNGIDAFANTDTIGAYYTGESTILSEVTKLANSVGGFLRFLSSDCKLQLYMLTDPLLATEIDLTLGEDDIVENGISVIGIEEPKKSITLGYKKNWTTQDTLATSITDATSIHYNIDKVNLYANEFSTEYSLTDISTAEYPLAEDVDMIETTIYEESDAITELARRIGLREKRRRVIRINSVATSFTYNIGDIVFIKHPRFGFTTGKKAIIIGIEEKPSSKRVILDVWI